MKNVLLVVAIICFSCTFCVGQTFKNVLFVGNSLTYCNDMPETLQKMLDEKHENIKIEQITFPGLILARHVTSNDSGSRLRKGELSPTAKKILSKDWDFVVLQEATVFLLIPEEREYLSKPAITKLDSLVKSKHGYTVLFQNYALSQYPAHYCHETDIIKELMEGISDTSTLINKDTCCSETFKNSREQFAVLEKVTKSLGDGINAKITQVGYAFEVCKEKYPEISLCNPDGHPSAIGSYLIACVFYKFLTNNRVSDLNYTGKVNAEKVVKIRGLVDDILK